MADKEIEKVEVNEEDLDMVAGGKIPQEIWDTMTDTQKSNAVSASLFKKYTIVMVCSELDEDVEWHGKVEDYN